jgi:hypothetical protein
MTLLFIRIVLSILYFPAVMLCENPELRARLPPSFKAIWYAGPSQTDKDSDCWEKRER